MVSRQTFRDNKRVYKLSSLGSVLLHDPPFDCATVIKLLVPPVLNPVASDIVNISRVAFGN